jgi:F-type H+-transporting ATPase subunit b
VRDFLRYACLLIACCLLVVLGSAQSRPAASAQQSPSASTAESATPKQDAKSGGDAGTKEAAEKNENDQFRHSPSIAFMARHLGISLDAAYWIGTLLNFAILAGAIFFGLKKSLPTFFRNRTSAIQKQMEEARRASDDANKRLKEIEAKLSRLGAEITDLHGAAAAQSKQDEARLKAALEEEKNKVLRSAEQEIAAAASSARRELQTYAANLVVGLAEKQIKVDVNTDQTLVKDFTEQLGRDAN